MDFRDRLPHLLALPLALALGGGATAPRTPAPARPVAEDTLVAWRIPGRVPNARAFRDTTEKHGGTASGHIVTTVPTRDMVNSAGGHGGGGEGGGGGGGPRMRPALFEQTLNAVPYRERRVRVALWVRTRLPDKPAKDMPSSQAHTFIRIDNEDGTFSRYDGSAILPIYGTTEWTRKVMVISVPPDAFALSFGVGVLGPGEVWVDDATIEDQGPAGGAYTKQPLLGPQQMARATPEQVARGKEMLARRVAFMKERPAEIVNGDFETK